MRIDTTYGWYAFEDPRAKARAVGQVCRFHHAAVSSTGSAGCVKTWTIDSAGRSNPAVANPEHLAELGKGVESWNQWRASHIVGPDRLEANLGLAHLVGAHLERADLEGAHLEGAHLEGVNLEGVNLGLADLEGANLERAHLGLADLEGANLERANLERAHLGLANLVGAHLERANLKWANLVGAHLGLAHLEGAHLEGVNLRGAYLREANLVGASCGQTSWGDLDLLETIGLSTLIHSFQSTLGTDTLILSKGRLPVEFLKGCGLADWEIESAKLYDPDLTTAEITDIQYRIYDLLARGPIQISPVFISYSHGDKAFVDKLGSKLDKKGVRFWRDIKDATAGRLDKVIDRGISSNPTLLLVLSEHAINSDWVEYEVDKAVRLSKKLDRDVLCPIALDKAWLESDRMSGNLRAQIKKYNVLDFGSHNDDEVFETQFRKLVDGLGLHYRNQTGAAARIPNRQ